jgi:hypothetical protein
MLAGVAAILAATTVPTSAAVPRGCSLSGPLFANPYSGVVGFNDLHATALRVYQRGLWLGIASDGGGRLRLLTWRRGHGVRTLAARRITGAPYGLGYSVQPIGVTPAGAVVANMQDDNSRTLRPFAYVGGHHFLLHSASTWRAATALAVTDDGRILGYSTIGRGEHLRYQLAVWRGIHAHPLLRRTVAPNGLPIADQAGDFAWVTVDPNSADFTFHVRSPSGQLRVLDFGRNYGGGFEPSAGHDLFTTINDGIMRFDSVAAGAGPLRGQVVARSRNQMQVLAAGQNGDFLDGNFRFHLASPARGVVVPGSFQGGDFAPPPAAIGPSHRLAFTSRRDHLVHLLTCR